MLPYTAFSKIIWQRVCSNYPQERLDKEVRRRSNVVGIFPGRGVAARFVGAVLVDQHVGRGLGLRYCAQEAVRTCLIGVTYTSNDTEDEEGPA